MNNYRLCCQPRLLLLLLFFPFFVSTASVCIEQSKCCSVRNKVLVIRVHEDRGIEIVGSKKGLFDFFAVLASSVFTALSDLKDSIEDIKALVEFIFWLQKEELEDEIKVPLKYEEYRRQISRLLVSLPDDPAIFDKPCDAQGIVIFFPGD